MRLENSTTWQNHFLRRMTAWCCRQLEIPVKTIAHARFRNSRSAWGGVARTWKRQISICVGRADCFPASCSTHWKDEVFADQLECLVAVTAHEAYHVAAVHVAEHRQITRRRRSFGSSERATCLIEMQALWAFRQQRDALIAEWSIEPDQSMQIKPTAQEHRATRAADRLAHWQRKAKLAATKIRKYKRQVAYYERTLAVAAIDGPA